MTILNQISLTLAGLGLLLFAMRHLTESLDREIVRYLGNRLQKITENSVSALFVGTLGTLLVQASSVTIIITMGFLSRGLLPLDRSILIMLGAALGSTLKGWYSSQFSLIFGPAFLLTGAIGLVTTKNQRRRRLFEVIASVGMTFLGLHLVETGLAPMAQTKEVGQLLTVSINHGPFSIFRTVLFGFLLSFILQSSSSVLLLVINFSTKGLISVPAALGLLLGANLGTTSTPLLASISQDHVDAKKLALSYLIIKLSAVTLVLTYFRTHVALLEDLAKFFGQEKRPDRLIVVFHTWFNLMNALTGWLLLPLLLRILAWIVPGKEAAFRTSPFTLRIQKIIENLPGIALSEGIKKIQQVIRDLHWVSDSIFHVIDGKENQDKCYQILEEGLQKCDRTVEVLNTVRELVWRHLRTLEHSSDSKRSVLGLVLLTGDLKNIESMLYSCIKTLSQDGFLPTHEIHSNDHRLRSLRKKLNSSWENMYLMEYSIKSSNDLNPELYSRKEVDVYLLEMSIRLNAIHSLMDHSPSNELLDSVRKSSIELSSEADLSGIYPNILKNINLGVSM